jgi:hypothetical protein
MLHAVQGGIERAIIDLEDVVGREANPLRDGEAVHRPPRQRLEDHDVERTLEQPEIG